MDFDTFAYSSVDTDYGQFMTNTESDLIWFIIEY